MAQMLFIYGVVLLAASITVADALRPALHVTPFNDAWLNDPNGLFRDADGLWHAYYQYDENVNAYNRKDWGHATSDNLWNWTHHPIAIRHDEDWGIWSGSLVIDQNNTSGFFTDGQTNGVVAIYTQAHLRDGWQEQAIAYSSDGGYTFTKYAQNPVLAIGSTEFRDPKVLWHNGISKWVMVVAYSADAVLGFYSSPDLKEWTWLSNFSNPNLPGGSNFECPGLARVPYDSVAGDDLMQRGHDSWVLLASSGGGNPLYHNDGSVTRYFPGHFNGTHFTAIDDRADKLIDFGPDNYATAIFHNTPHNEAMVTMGWATNLAYAGGQPSGEREGWRGILTSVRSAVLLKGDDGEVHYHSFPLGLHDLKKVDLGSMRISHDMSKELSFKSVATGSVLLDAQVQLLSAADHNDRATEASLDIIFKSSKSRESMTCSLAFRSASQPSFVCERGNVLGGWTGRPAENMRTMRIEQVPQYNSEDRTWTITTILDHSVLEVFLNKGIAAGTFTLFPSEEMDIVAIRTRGIKDKFDVSVDIMGLLGY